jgi:hypothetical protein
MQLAVMQVLVVELVGVVRVEGMKVAVELVVVLVSTESELQAMEVVDKLLTLTLALVVMVALAVMLVIMALVALVVLEASMVVEQAVHKVRALVVQVLLELLGLYGEQEEVFHLQQLRYRRIYYVI